MRESFTGYATAQAKSLLDQLLACHEDDFKTYQDVMRQLGHELGKTLLEQLKGKESQEILLACTVEDADFLAKGLLSELENSEFLVRLACFWNEKTFSPHGYEDFEMAPIIKAYEEPLSGEKSTLVIVKSIISGACVVATNITHLISERDPDDIFVCAPVMLAGAETRLHKHFDRKVVSKFRYLTFRVDAEKDGEIIKPGIGGNVYARYGFTDEKRKNHILPKLVAERRELIAT